MTESRTNQILGGYRIAQKIASGGMGEVYRAVQISVDRNVALKILPVAFADDPDLVSRFRQEARTIAKLEHPHILHLIDYGEQDGLLYLVTRFVNGGTLHDVLQKGPLLPGTALRYLADIGEALDYAHSQNIIHRDIKPKNILLDVQGNPFVADFGLAKLLGDSAIKHSNTGGIIGTPHYMSPEQGRGQPVDGRSDLYSLAILFFEMLTGRVPFIADSAMGIIMKHITEDPPRVTQLNLHLPTALDDFFTRALAKEPIARYQTAHEMAEDAARALGIPIPHGSAISLGIDLAHAAGVDPNGSTIPFGPPHAKPTLPKITGPQWLMFVLGGVVAFVALLIGGSVLAPRLIPVPEATRLPTGVPRPATSTLAPTPVPATFTPSPLPSPTAIPTLIVAAPDAMEQILIPAGKFLSGSSSADPNAKPDEPTQHSVDLPAYWIDRTEVSVAQFQDFVNATNYKTDAERGCCADEWVRAGGVIFAPDQAFEPSASWKRPEGASFDDALPRRPVVQVSWNDAQAYCEWAGRRLPSAAEWEKAARGVDGRIYPWGDTFNGTALNFCDRNCGNQSRLTEFDDSFRRTGNVGSFAAGVSPYGIFDLSGNAREWVSDDWILPTPTASPNATAKPPALQHFIYGGSWLDLPATVRISSQITNPPDARDDLTGFRCAVSDNP